MSSEADTLKLSLQLTAHDRRSLEVRATAPGGEARAETDVPPRVLLDQLASYDLTNIPISVLQSVGTRLYQCLMPGDVAKLATNVIQDGIRLNQPVHFELRFDADQVSLAQYPWEMITNELGQFLVGEGLVDLTRYIAYPQPPPIFDSRLDDSMLLRVIAQPTTLPPVTVTSLIAARRIETLEHTTFHMFQHKLLIERLKSWGLQFDGHGALMLQCFDCDTVNALDGEMCWRCGTSLSVAKQIGVLAFEMDGDVDWISAKEFGSVLYNANIRLALLLACETACTGNRLIFGGLAPGLILAGVPVVIGMQYPVLDSFANSFANDFYEVFFQTNDVLAATRVARRMQIQGAWYSPVLYLRYQSAGDDESLESSYHSRIIDTAVPSKVQVGQDFLVRLWVRRPETKPLAEEQLRNELDVSEPESISIGEMVTDVKFETLEGGKLRRGEIEVRCNSISCEVTPESIKLFVDEHVDAPVAFFKVRANKTGPASLIFSVWQDGGQIATVAHCIQVVDRHLQPGMTVKNSHTIPVEDPAVDVMLKAWQSLITLAPQLTLKPSTPMLVPRAAQPSTGELSGIPARYVLKDELGRGASSIVYRATDSHLGRTVAIKSLHGHLADSPDVSRHRLLKEAQAASKLQHPHIVTIFDAIEVNDHICLVMEYVEGQTLAGLLREEKRLSLDEVIALVEQAADALDYAHRQGVVHRDIKPANLMITGEGVLKLTDFGIAKKVSALQTTEEGAIKGTVTYMSPEQVKEKALDGRSDLFSLATVAFEMLSGVPPWPDTAVFDIMSNIREAKTLSLSDLDVPGAVILDPIFRTALAEDPDKRYQSGKEFVNALRTASQFFTDDGTGVDALGIGDRWAVLVGVSYYDDKTHYGRLEVCVKDVQAIRDRLVDSGFDQGQIRLLTDETEDLPLKENILETLQTIAAGTKPEDVLLFYYSGHGDEVGGESYLVARNGRRTILSDSAVPVSRIKEMMGAAPARAKVIVLDACHAGADIKGRKGKSPMPRDFIRRVCEQAKGLAIMASCQQGEFSYEWRNEDQSVFTHFLLEALGGGADRDGKGFVTVQDVNRHVSDGVQRWASDNKVSQTPTLQYTVSRDIILAVYH